MYRTYDVQCEDCDKIFEVFVDEKEEVPICPYCCGSKLKRLFTSFNFKLVYNNKTDICGGGDNNYEASQYHRKIKEEEERTGKKHKTIYDD